MALREETICASVTVVSQNNNVLEVREQNIFYRNEVEANRSNHRFILVPGYIGTDNIYRITDLTGQHRDVINIANAVWTADIHRSYEQVLRQ